MVIKGKISNEKIDKRIKFAANLIIAEISKAQKIGNQKKV